METCCPTTVYSGRAGQNRWKPAVQPQSTLEGQDRTDGNLLSNHSLLWKGRTEQMETCCPTTVYSGRAGQNRWKPAVQPQSTLEGQDRTDGNLLSNHSLLWKGRTEQMETCCPTTVYSGRAGQNRWKPAVQPQSTLEGQDRTDGNLLSNHSLTASYIFHSDHSVLWKGRTEQMETCCPTTV